jgi:hypothetical protein
MWLGRTWQRPELRPGGLRGRLLRCCGRPPGIQSSILSRASLWPASGIWVLQLRGVGRGAVVGPRTAGAHLLRAGNRGICTVSIESKRAGAGPGGRTHRRSSPLGRRPGHRWPPAVRPGSAAVPGGRRAPLSSRNPSQFKATGPRRCWRSRRFSPFESGRRGSGRPFRRSRSVPKLIVRVRFSSPLQVRNLSHLLTCLVSARGAQGRGCASGPVTNMLAAA